MFDYKPREIITIAKLKHGQVALSAGHSFEPMTYEVALERATRIANSQKVEVQIIGIIKTIGPETIKFKNLKIGDKFIFATESVRDNSKKIVLGNPNLESHYFSFLKSKRETDNIVHSANPDIECVKLN